MPRPEARIYVDGGARGNPGPAGYGVLVTGPGGEPLGRYFGYIGPATNNVAEYRGLVAALEPARQLGLRRLWVGSDSELMVRQMRGEYKVKNAGLRPLFERCQRMAAGFDEFTIEHLPREENTEADRLANQAMNLRQSELPPGVSAGRDTPEPIPAPQSEAPFVGASGAERGTPAAEAAARPRAATGRTIPRLVAAVPRPAVPPASPRPPAIAPSASPPATLHAARFLRLFSSLRRRLPATQRSPHTTLRLPAR